MIPLLIYIVGFVVTGVVVAAMFMKEEGKEELDFDIASIATFFAMCWPILLPFAFLMWGLKTAVNKVLREVRKR